MITKKKRDRVVKEGGRAFSRPLNIVVLASQTRVINLEIPTCTVWTDISDKLFKRLIQLTASLHCVYFSV